MFKKKAASEPTLHEINADAENRAARAVSLFHAVAVDLRDAADLHDHVASEAQARIDDLEALRDAAQQATVAKARQADAIAALVG